MADAAVLDAPPWSALVRHRRVLGELVLVLAVVWLYRLESAALLRVLALATGGFALSLVAPLAWRLRIFVGLSLLGIVWVLGPVDGIWTIALGLGLIALAHLPVRTAWRAALIAVAAVGLAALRAGAAGSPWSAAVWPVLGSMFMFRMVLYLRALAAGQAEGGLTAALAYFFMLPNAAFPLFPVVDFQTFRRTWFDREEAAIYAQGMLWIVRGLVHLLLYRLVYYRVVGDPLDVVRLGDLVQFMLGTFLLYLRVSGQFHLIVGLLHLFGFRLPETHKLYYLAHSFTELWRRINIYWTDFMMKSTFYPAYFRLKRLGPASAFALATALVFVTTWLLHSYQWFWLRGGFPVTAPDILFWGILGALVIRGGLRELKGSRAPRRRAKGWNGKLGLRAAATFGAFCFLWSLWSADSIGQWLWMLGAASDVDARGLALLAGALGTVAIVGGWDWQASRPDLPAAIAWIGQPAVRTLVPLVAMVALAHPALQAAAPAPVAGLLYSLQDTALNARDAALQHRGYYEALDVRATLAAAAQGGIAREHWKSPADMGIIRERMDRLGRDLYPSLQLVWNGNPFSTNEFGMRDRAYTRAKPPGTLRIALTGPSHVMGNGVADGETFESLVEERLNRELGPEQGRRFEILNFAVDGYTLPQQLALFEDRILDFSPDVLLLTNYHAGKTMTERYLLKMVWNDIRLPDEPLRALLAGAGLEPLDRQGVPVPFAPARALARSLGLQARMPWAESQARVRRISDPVNDWALGRIVEVARAHGVQPLMLALDAVIDDAPTDVPNGDAARAAGVPVLDLIDVFPREQRAQLRVAPWDDHPTAAGHRLIADRLYAELVPHLTR
jgi:hypothetical protein